MPLDKKLLNSAVSDHSVLMQLEQDVGMETLNQLIHLFVSELATLDQRLCDAIAQANTKEIQEVVHILKNSAALFGAMPLATLAEQLHGAHSLNATVHLAAAETIRQSIAISRDAYQRLAERI
jgi:two-component system, phosphorelay protein LuxU